MDVVTLFAIVVFSVAWVCHVRTDRGEPLVRLFFGLLMALGAGAGLLGLLLRLTTAER
jgi:hypothetical protein